MAPTPNPVAVEAIEAALIQVRLQLIALTPAQRPTGLLARLQARRLTSPEVSCTLAGGIR